MRNLIEKELDRGELESVFPLKLFTKLCEIGVGIETNLITKMHLYSK